jgi:glyoxylase-like metal-dependent hydrolase (beta-lactamase superfamily II)
VIPPFVDQLPFDISCIDTGLYRPKMACCYLMRSGGQAAIIECGTARSVNNILNALGWHDMTPDDVRWILPTHVHLDHAGGAGLLMQHCRNATLVAHPRAARHLVDPSRLWDASIGVYGEQELVRHYEKVLPVDETRIVIANDGFDLDFNGRLLRFIDTPGHARHHYSIYDERSAGFFTGDTFGMSYRELDSSRGAFIMPISTPVQFEPDAWFATLERYLTFAPRRMFLTHYSMVEDVPRLAADLRAALQRYVAVALEFAARSDRLACIGAALMDDALRGLAESGCPLPAGASRGLLKFDMELNAQGLCVWLDKNLRNLQ